MIHKIVSTQSSSAPSEFHEALASFNFSPEQLAEATRVVTAGAEFYRLPTCPIKGVDSHELLNKISTGLTAHLSDKDLVDSAIQVIGVIFDNCPKLVQDSEISEGIRLKINPKRITDIMIKISLAFSDNPMTAQVLTGHGVEVQDLMEHFKRISTKLKKDACAEYPRASHWNVRKVALWKWCLVMAEETRHPLVRYCEETIQDKEIEDVLNADFKKLFRIISELIMFIAFCDDISDNLADKELSDLFRNVPFLQEHQIPEEIKKVEKIGGGIFKDFYIQSVRVWQDSMKKFAALVGEDLLVSRWGELRKLYSFIMGSMSLSVDLNLDPHKYESRVDDIDAGLAPNMMIESFRWMERLLLADFIKRHPLPEGVKLPTGSVETQINELISLSQISGSQSNTMATFYREILTEDDMSNPIVFRLNRAYNQLLAQRSSTVETEFKKFLEENKYDNHFFSDYAPPKDFIDFMLLKNHIVRVLFNELQQLCKTHKIEINFGNYDSIQEMMTGILPEIKKKVISELYQNDVRSLERRLKHLILANCFARKVAIECKALLSYNDEYLRNIDKMRMKVLSIPSEFQGACTAFVDSCEEFAVMYLLFRHKPGGMI